MHQEVQQMRLREEQMQQIDMSARSQGSQIEMNKLLTEAKALTARGDDAGAQQQLNGCVGIAQKDLQDFPHEYFAEQLRVAEQLADWGPGKLRSAAEDTAAETTQPGQ
jgi:hypothetical protein